MHNLQKKIILIFIIFLVQGCAGVSDVGKTMRNEKIKTTDEFLVKKREPLALPPDYSEIPRPGTMTESETRDEDSKRLEKIIKIEKEKTAKGTSAGSVEESILNKIGK
jgi:hypothetical protein